MSSPPRRPLRFVGVDLASQPKKSSLAVVEWDERPRVIDLIRPAVDDLIVEQAATADAVGLDCPFGWPDKFVETVRRHHDGHAVGVIDASPRELRLRTTDRWIREHHLPRDPLSVSTDRLGVVALRGIRILERIAGPGADRSGAAGVYEAYPGGSLAKWGIRSTGYKDPVNIEARRGIVDAMSPHVDLDGWVDDLIANDDDLDAVITAVVAGLAHMGATTDPPDEHREMARVEGWIHVPELPIDALGHVRQP